jgi:hypothetical protein
VIFRQLIRHGDYKFYKQYPSSSLAGEPMRVTIAAIVAANLFFSTAVAEPALRPGKPAGVKQAGITSERKEVLLISGVLLVSTGLVIALVAHKNSDTHSGTTSTSP